MKGLWTGVLLLAGALAGAQSLPPENWEVRAQLLGDFFEGPQAIRAREGKSEVFAQKGYGHKVQRSVSLRTAQDGKPYLWVQFLNPGPQGAFSLRQAGNVFVKLDPRTAQILQVKILTRDLRDDKQAWDEASGGSFLRIHARGPQLNLEVVLLGETLVQDQNVNFSFRQVLEMPLAELVRRTRTLVDWDLVFPELPHGGPQVTRLMDFAQKIRQELYSPAGKPRMEDVFDGAMDAQGKFVTIETGGPQEGKPGFNCSGLVKWVADGLYMAYTGRRMDLEPLKRKNYADRGTDFHSDLVETLRDPFFGLDWTRNIAMTLDQARSPGSHAKDSKLWDVGSNPYALASPGRGFPLGKLDFVLYYQAVKNPGRVIFATLNGPVTLGGQTLIQHFHTAVFIPYLDPSGVFRIRVFENTQETSLQNFINRGKLDGTYFAHLVSVPLPPTDKPPRLTPLPR